MILPTDFETNATGSRKILDENALRIAELEAALREAQRLEREAFGAGLLAATNHFISAFERANDIDPQLVWLNYRGETIVDKDKQ